MSTARRRGKTTNLQSQLDLAGLVAIEPRGRLDDLAADLGVVQHRAYAVVGPFAMFGCQTTDGRMLLVRLVRRNGEKRYFGAANCWCCGTA
jgi:hypothetical protein